jgi:hypothetical protein
MTSEERIAALEQRLAYLEGRVATLEAKNLTFGPLPNIPPTNPWPVPSPSVYPWTPPWTVTCKMADGTVKEMTLNSPIVAQNNG